MQDLELFDQIDQADHAGDCLRNIGCHSGTQNTHIKVDDEHQIQHNVDSAGQHQEVKRGFAVAQSAHDGRNHIIEKNKGNSRKDPANVGAGTINNVRRGLHQLHNGAGQRHRDNGKPNTPGNAQPGCIGHMAAQVAVIMGTKQLCDGDSKAVAHANNKTQDQIVDRAGSANCRQRIDTDKTAHNDGICQAVKLLEQVAQHQRQGVNNRMILNGFPLVKSLVICVPSTRSFFHTKQRVKVKKGWLAPCFAQARS